MSKLEHVANLRRELAVLLEEMMEESALALFARWMLEKRTDRAGGAGSGANGSEEKARVSRRAQGLLADFVSESARANGSAPPLGGSNGKCRLGEGEGAGRSNGADVNWQEVFPGAREHVPPPRGTPRPDKRLDRKSARPGRPCGRSPNASP